MITKFCILIFCSQVVNVLVSTIATVLIINNKFSSNNLACNKKVSCLVFHSHEIHKKNLLIAPINYLSTKTTYLSLWPYPEYNKNESHQK